MQRAALMSFRRAPATLCRQLINLREFEPYSYATKSKNEDNIKSKPSKGGEKGARGGSGDDSKEAYRDKRFQTLMKTLTPAEIPDVQRTPEELAEAKQRFKLYSRNKMAEHRAWQKDISRKIELVQLALAALPPHLRAAAEQIDNTPFPANRLVPTTTPPIKGYEAEGKSTRGKGKL